MAEIVLPKATVARIMKKLNEKIIISGETKTAMTKVAGLFVLYITTIASSIAEEKRGNKKTVQIKPEHVM
jgi:histone H3/H4